MVCLVDNRMREIFEQLTGKLTASSSLSRVGNAVAYGNGNGRDISGPQKELPAATMISTGCTLTSRYGGEIRVHTVTIGDPPSPENEGSIDFSDC